jgi:hypothetical protein
VEVVEGGGATAQQELAQDGHLAILQPEIAGLDEIDPRLIPELGIIEGEDDLDR